MKQVNMLEAKTELSRLVKQLENHEEEVIILARNGKPVAQITLIQEKPASRRIGIAAGKFTVPEEFDAWDAEITEMFGEI